MGTLFLLSLIPLILFAIINYYSNLKTGVISGIVTALILAVISKVYFDYFDFEVVLMIIFLLVMGTWSIRTNNELYFKLQPALTSLCSIAILAWYQFFDTPFFLKFIPKFKEILSADQFELINSPEAQAVLVRMTAHGMIWILLHAALLAWAAKYSSTKVWLAIKALFLPYFMLAILLTEYIYSKF